MIGAIEQCIASARSLNLHDTPVCRQFIMDLMGGAEGCRTKIFETEDGQSMSTKEALEWLKSRRNAEEGSHA